MLLNNHYLFDLLQCKEWSCLKITNINNKYIRHYDAKHYNKTITNKLIRTQLKFRIIFWGLYVRVMVFKATFYYISVISWRSIYLVEESVVHRENHRPVTSHWQPLLYKAVSSTPVEIGIQTHNLVVICTTGCRGSCNSNYHMIMTTTTPGLHFIV